MLLVDRIADELKDALKAGNSDKVSVLRLVRSSVKNREIEKGASLDESEVQAILRSFVKRARESIEQYTKAGRADLAQKEEKELTIIEEYLPTQLSDEVVRDAVSSVIAELEASGVQDLGRVMKASMKKLQGAADGKRVNIVAKELLEN